MMSLRILTKLKPKSSNINKDTSKASAYRFQDSSMASTITQGSRIRTSVLGRNPWPFQSKSTDSRLIWLSATDPISTYVFDEDQYIISKSFAARGSKIFGRKVRVMSLFPQDMTCIVHSMLEAVLTCVTVYGPENWHDHFRTQFRTMLDDGYSRLQNDHQTICQMKQTLDLTNKNVSKTGYFDFANWRNFLSALNTACRFSVRWCDLLTIWISVIRLPFNLVLSNAAMDDWRATYPPTVEVLPFWATTIRVRNAVGYRDENSTWMQGIFRNVLPPNSRRNIRIRRNSSTWMGM